MRKLLPWTLALLFCIISASVALSGELEDRLADAIYFQEVEVVRNLIDQGVDVNAWVVYDDGQYVSMLSYALDAGFLCWDDEECWKRSDEIVRLLEEAGAVEYPY